MNRPEVGSQAPPFDRESDGGERVTLESLHGRPAVLYFYPKDDTPGCTRQACSIRDSWSQFERAGVALYGVSPDSAESHTTFKQKYSLPFPLLADADHSMADAFGVWVEKTNYGKTYWGVTRSTFIIDGEGTVVHVIEKASPKTHAADVLAVLEGATA